MLSEKNREIAYGQRRYEIFWATQYADHIRENFTHPAHRISFREISELLGATRVIVPQKRGKHRNYFVFLGIFNEVVYETYVTLLAGRGALAGRAIVHTSYRSNKPAYINEVRATL